MLIKKDGITIGQTDNLEKFLEQTRLKKEDIEIIYTAQELNELRDRELKGFVIDNIFMNEDIIKTMAVAYNIAGDNEAIEWINVDNKVVKFTKADFGALIKQGSYIIKEIYFKYRKLKDKL